MKRRGLANRSSFAVGAVTEDVIATQQGVADRSFKLGLISRPVVVRDAVWRPAQT
jgi:sulfonate transport system substrate-binding protein